jgi:hypothetical protein
VFDAMDTIRDGELDCKELIEQSKLKFDIDWPKKTWSSAFK